MGTTRTMMLAVAILSILLMITGAVAAQSATGMKFRNGATLTVTFLSQDPDPAEPGSYVDLRWKVENLGNENLKDVKFVLDVEPPFTLNDPNEKTKALGDVGTQQIDENSIILHWRLRVDENALEGNNQVKLNYFIDDVGVKLDPFKVNIKNRQALIAVDKIEISPADPTPGKTVNMTIQLHNVADTTIQDLKVHLDLDGTDLAAVGSTNEYVINRLSAGEHIMIPFTLVVDPSAASKVHQVPLTIEYSNKFGDDFKLNTSFGVLIAATTDYLMNLEKTEVYTADSKGKVTLSVSNVGKSDLNFVTLEILPSDQYSVLSASQVYIGNLQSDDFETGEFTVYVQSTKEKNVDLKVRLRFKDVYNKLKEEEMTIPMRLYTTSEARRIGLVSSSHTGLILVVVLLIVLALVEWRRKWKDIARLKQRIGMEHTSGTADEERKHRR